jgi:probable rRNA maturation factor
MHTSAIRTAHSRAAEYAPRTLRLTVQNASGATGLPARSTLRRWLARALARDAIVTVRFVDAAEGRRLNRAFRGRDYATNVLTFGYDAPAAPAGAGRRATPPPLTGDIVLCVAVLRREARAQRKTLRAHCAHLLIHGALHLSGYDHESAKDAKVMEALEVELLDSLGYDNPYATEAAPG